ncbi:MAG: hypothetical protein IMX01_04995 [Limnochordaceae bacterium]|nr:hypothetical protein [Limnochordaceae bacterium]
MISLTWTQWGQLLLLTVVLSLDALAAGVAYGLRRIRVPMPSLLLMSGGCGLLFAGANSIGHVLTWALGTTASHWLGGILLIGRGVWMGLQPRPEQNGAVAATAEGAGGESATAARPWVHLEMKLRSVGLVIQILRYPDTSDLDRSGLISGAEAVLMGFALALDSLGVGMAAALGHDNGWLAPVLLAAGTALALWLGSWWGGRATRRWWGRRTGEPAARGEPSQALILAQQWLAAAVLVGLGAARLLAMLW